MAESKEEARFLDQFDTVQSERPAYLVRNVDEQEQAFILDSLPASPVESPRGLKHAQEDESSEDQPAKRTSFRPSDDLLSALPLPGGSIDPELLSPGPAEEGNKVGAEQGAQLSPIQHNMYLRQSEEWVNRLAHDARHEGEWQRTKEGKWSVNHARVLYLISLFASDSKREPDTQQWLNDVFIQILAYEAVAQGLFTMLVTPLLVQMRDENKKTVDVWLKLPKEVKIILYELCSASYLDLARFPTEEAWNFSSYRVSKRGEGFLQETPDELKEEVDMFLKETFNAPASKSASEIAMSITNFSFRDGQIFVHLLDGSDRISSITKIESISYVTSPHIPASVRLSEKQVLGIEAMLVGWLTLLQLTDNSDVAPLCPQWQDEVVDYRSESFIMSSVTVLLGDSLAFSSSRLP
eukprot:755846-Hanusia_phi.AAC.4